MLPFADRSNLLDLTKRSKELVKLAKDGKLQPEQYSGGTFTISNLGMQGIEEFTAIINPPQAAILAVGATIATPTVGATGEILVEQKMKVTLSCDHRVIDGFEGSQFLKTLKSYLEDPYNALFFFYLYNMIKNRTAYVKKNPNPISGGESRTKKQ